MHNFKKLVIGTLSLILTLVILFGVITAPAFMNGSNYNDSAARLELSGEIDYLFSGASHGQGAFVPSVIDEELDVCSYNLSSYAAYFGGRYVLLQKEIERNNLDTVVIEIACDSFGRLKKNENATGEPHIICKLDTPQEQISYFFQNVDFFNNDYEKFISVFLRYGLKEWASFLRGEFGSVQRRKGYVPVSSSNVSLSNSEIISMCKSDDSVYKFEEENIEWFEKMVELCHQNDVRVIVAVVPISETFIWQNNKLDDFYSQLNELCAENDCSIYDFNLLKSRFELFSDENSFCNLTHMSDDGARVFSKAFSEIIQKINEGEDVSELFYDNYSEMIADSSYMDFYVSNAK